MLFRSWIFWDGSRTIASWVIVWYPIVRTSGTIIKGGKNMGIGICISRNGSIWGLGDIFPTLIRQFYMLIEISKALGSINPPMDWIITKISLFKAFKKSRKACWGVGFIVDGILFHILWKY